MLDDVADDVTDGANPKVPLVSHVETTGSVLYAMAHNRISPVTRLSLIHLDGMPLRDVDVEVTVRADGRAVSRPWRRHIDEMNLGAMTFEDVAIHLDPDAMSGIEEQRPGVISVSLAARDHTPITDQEPVQILAHNQWSVAESWRLSAELLCAFVMPNHPAVSIIRDRAAERLRALTGSPSISGYHEGLDRVHLQARALWESLQDQHVRYSVVAASWDVGVGQKIRTPQQVLDDRFGNCLDLSVLYAAALEQSGLLPTLWVTTNHAFVGYWTGPSRSLEGGFADDIPPLANLVDLGALTLVEVTAACDRQDAASFDVACTTARALLSSQDDAPVQAVIDVAAARRGGVAPLPARSVAPDGSVTVHPWVAPSPVSAPEATPAPFMSVGRPNRAAQPPRVRAWKSRLLDLTRRNQLISVSTSRSGLDLHIPPGGLARFGDDLMARTSFTVVGGDDVSATHAAQGFRVARDLPDALVSEDLFSRRLVYAHQIRRDTERRLRTLATKSRTVRQETGSNVLYVSFGLLRWRLKDGNEVRSPLVLVPVRIQGSARDGRVSITLDETGSTAANWCLIERLRQDHAVDVPGLAEPSDDGVGLDINGVLRLVRDAVDRHDLSAQVEERAVLSVFDYARFPLWRDLDEQWAHFAGNRLVRHLIEGSPDGIFDGAGATSSDAEGSLDALAALCPVPADSAQLEAVAAAVRGETFVLEGPPGTGKSQTITNLLARAMGEGRTVLFVAEKAAALDVVTRRVNEAGLGPFTLDLHDRSSRPSHVRAQLLAAVDLAIEHDPLDVDIATSVLASQVAALAGYAFRLHENGPAGRSLHAAHNEVLALPVGRIIEVTADIVANGGLRNVEAAAADVENVGGSVRPAPDHPWAFINEPTERPILALTDTDIRTAVAAVDAALVSIDTLGQHPARWAAHQLRDLDDAGLLAMALSPQTPDLAVMDEVGTARWLEAASAAEGALHSLWQPSGPAGTVDPAIGTLPVDELLNRAREAAASSFVTRGRRLKALAPDVAACFTSRQIDRHDLVAAAEWLVWARDAVLSCGTMLAELPGVRSPDGWNPLSVADRDEALAQLSRLRFLAPRIAADGQEFVQHLRATLAMPLHSRSDAEGPARALIEALRHLHQLFHLSAAEWRLWLDGRTFVESWRTSHPKRERDLAGSPAGAVARWETFVAAARPFAQAGLFATYRDLLTGVLPSDEVSHALRRGTARAILRERLSTQGFDDFDPERHDTAIDRFVSQAPRVRRAQATALPAQLLARRLARTPDQVRMRGLRKELSRQRGGKSIRDLITAYGDIVLTLTPCVLVSPASLARFFPAQAVTFDLVVFDEASQIRVADAVGAMGRARSVVVVGDSQQMPPSTLMEAAMADEDEDDLPEGVELIEPDLESILSECVSAQVPRRWLTWHYRSEDESLIAFSNQHFYDGMLSSFPGPGRHGQPGYGIHFRRVQGHFARRDDHREDDGRVGTNLIEAQAVVTEVERRFSACSPSETPSIGVVTFNVQQRDLILDLFRRSDVTQLADGVESDEPNAVFVKNLENVQGDERDTILFSTGFSLNQRGVLPLRFGPLNLGGGERRLNVAITRARREVVMFCSFDPEQLRAEQTQAKGVKLLRAYLDLAKNGVGQSGDTIARKATSIDRHRDDVAAELRERGWVVTTDVGLSQFRIDLSVAHAERPEHALLAVLLDGPNWAKRRTVGDRDALPVDVLQRNMGWPGVARIWLPTWLQNRSSVLDKLDAMLVDLHSRLPERDRQLPVAEPATAPGAAAAAASSWDAFLISDEQPSTVHDVVTAPAPAVIRTSGAPTSKSHPVGGPVVRTGVQVVEFQAWQPGILGSIADLNSPRERRTITRHLTAALEIESPVPLDRLTRLIGNAYGLARVTSGRAEELATLVPTDAVVDSDAVVWRAGLDPESWELVRRSDDPRWRPLDQVPLHEIGNALVLAAGAANGLGDEALMRGALAYFGGKRLTDTIESRLEKAIRRAGRRGRIERINGLWRLPHG